MTNQKDKKGVIAMDRDETVEVNNGPVTLEMIDQLKKDWVVYATGNQALTDEADLPGTADIPGTSAEMPKAVTMTYLKEKYPGYDRYIIVDDEEGLSSIKGWEYYTPDDFVEYFHNTLSK